MKTNLYRGIAALAVLSGLAVVLVPRKSTSPAPVAQHESREEEKARYHEARVRYEFDMIKDPATGKIPAGIFQQELAFARAMPVRSGSSTDQRTSALNNYFPAGPNNVGGRTRAAAYDVRYNGSTNRVIIAGCVSGGIMRSTDGGNTWTLVTPENDIHNLTALAQDPRPGFQDTWYAGGGEAYGNSASELGATYLGHGVWKSIDNGATWTKLPLNTITDINGNLLGAGTLEGFDHPFDFVHRLAVNPQNGDLYVAGHRRVMRSTNGGASFQVVLGSATTATSTTGQTEVLISSGGRVLAAINGAHPDASFRGVWISSTGSLNSFTRIAGGQTLGVDSVDGWRANDPTGGGKRIILTQAPSNNNIVYVFYENGLSSDQAQPEADLYRLDISTTTPPTYTWSNRSANMPNHPAGDLSGSDPLALQGGYNMVVSVKPDNPDMVFVGGTNLYRSSDGFTTNQNIAWINGYTQTPMSYTPYPSGHADQHTLIFNPVNPNEAISGDDGGLRRTTNIGAGIGSAWPLQAVGWTPLPNYQTLQYYYVSIDPGAGRNNFMGGAQDNNTQFRDKTGIAGATPPDSNNHVRLIGGDGGAAGIGRYDEPTQTQFLYGSAQYGILRRIRATAGSLFPSFAGQEIRPNNLTTAYPGATSDYGEFVTNFRVNPDNTDDLYYVNFNRLFRTTSASTVAPTTWTELTGVSSAINPSNGRNIGIRALGFSRGPYISNHSLFIGTTSGKIYRVDDPRNANAFAPPVDITPPLPAGQTNLGNVQDIAVNPNNDEEIMAVVTNYGVVSIWWTNNAKSVTPTWRNAEGNLTIPSVRSCAIVVKKDAANNPVTEYYVGTSVGLYSASNLNITLPAGTPPVWQREGGSMLNFAVVQSLAYRPVDNVLLVGTHGNGMYYGFMGTPNFIPNQATGFNPITNDRNFIRTVLPVLTPGQVQYTTGNMTGIKKITVQVMDLTGRVVYRKETGYQSGSVNLGPYASGAYVLGIFSDDGRYRHIQKLVKQ
jgi:hypothetical protein